MECGSNPKLRAKKRGRVHGDDDNDVNHMIDNDSGEDTTDYTYTIHHHNDDSTTTMMTTSIHHHRCRSRRRPVKKRQVMVMGETSHEFLSSIHSTTTTTTTTHVPDLIHETNRPFVVPIPTNTTTTLTTTTKDAMNHQLRHEREKKKSDPEEDISFGIGTTLLDEFEVIPSPPPFQRAVAQVFQYNHETYNYETQEQPPQQQELSTSSVLTKKTSSLLLDLVPTTPMNRPSMVPCPATMPYHHPSLATSLLQNDLPLIHDIGTSVSLVSSIPPAVSLHDDGSKTNHKNHNKILPKSNCSKNTTCLITEYASGDDDWSRDTYHQNSVTGTSSTTAVRNDDGTALASSSRTMLHPTSPMEIPPTIPIIPPSFMSGKVIATKYGLAMVVVPSSDVTISDYTNTFASSSTTSTSTHTHGNVAPSPSPDFTFNDTTTGNNSTVTRFKHWLKSEDELLLYAIQKQESGPPYMWQQIAQTYFPNTRNANQCKSRWKKIDPSLMKNAFTAEEDEIILKGERDGLSWPDIANQLPGRNSDQIRFRFLNTINPQLLKNVAWTAEEERVLNTAQSELGNKWSIIASLLPGRSENDIKNHWHNRKLKAQRKLKSLAALSKRNETLTNLRNGMCDIVIQNYETDAPLLDADTIEASVHLR